MVKKRRNLVCVRLKKDAWFKQRRREEDSALEIKF